MEHGFQMQTILLHGLYSRGVKCYPVLQSDRCGLSNMSPCIALPCDAVYYVMMEQEGVLDLGHLNF